MKANWRPITIILLILGVFAMGVALALGLQLPDVYITSYFALTTVFATGYAAGRSFEKGKGVE